MHISKGTLISQGSASTITISFWYVIAKRKINKACKLTQISSFTELSYWNCMSFYVCGSSLRTVAFVHTASLFLHNNKSVSDFVTILDTASNAVFPPPLYKRRHYCATFVNKPIFCRLPQKHVNPSNWQGWYLTKEVRDQYLQAEGKLRSLWLMMALDLLWSQA